jgi:hypothetical protein
MVCTNFQTKKKQKKFFIRFILDHNPDDQQQISVDQQISSLKKQLEIELKVKTGAESILNTYTGQRKETYRKMCDEAQIVLKDAKAKADFLRMQIKRLENGKYSLFFIFRIIKSNSS